MQKDAIVSETGRYRYRLTRKWNDKDKNICFVMLNPSTADASVDDPTIQSCMRIAAMHGYGSLTVVNLYALRSTDPDQLAKVKDATGGYPNKLHIEAAVRECDTLLYAWGSHKFAKRQAQRVIADIAGLIDREDCKCGAPVCLHINKDGMPKHPLYVAAETPFEPYLYLGEVE